MVTVSPSEEVGERNRTRCGDLFGGGLGLGGRGTAWERHRASGVSLAFEGGGGVGGRVECSFPQNGTARLPWPTERRGSFCLSTAGVFGLWEGGVQTSMLGNGVALESGVSLLQFSQKTCNHKTTVSHCNRRIHSTCQD